MAFFVFVPILYDLLRVYAMLVPLLRYFIHDKVHITEAKCSFAPVRGATCEIRQMGKIGMTQRTSGTATCK